MGVSPGCAQHADFEDGRAARAGEHDLGFLVRGERNAVITSDARLVTAAVLLDERTLRPLVHVGGESSGLAGVHVDLALARVGTHGGAGSENGVGGADGICGPP